METNATVVATAIISGHEARGETKSLPLPSSELLLSCCYGWRITGLRRVRPMYIFI